MGIPDIAVTVCLVLTGLGLMDILSAFADYVREMAKFKLEQAKKENQDACR